ncbi:MAG: hypothetical protein ACE5KM_02330 [Planctomycetaceae bacterium]
MLMNPALTQLLRFRGTAKLRRWARNFQSPRKLLLSVTALLLAAVWLGNALVSILLRTPYPLATVRDWVLLSIMGYSLWHVVKVAWKRPDEAIAWHPSEREMVCGGPFSRREMLTYRLTTVMTAATFKALCASLLFLPELPLWPVGFAGMFLALALVELLRMAMEIAAHGFGSRVYQLFRIGVFGCLGVIVIGSIVAAMRHGAPASTVELLNRVLATVVELRHTPVGRLWEAAFVPFADLITARSFGGTELVQPLLVSLLVTGGATWMVIRLDRFFFDAAILAERRAFEEARLWAEAGPPGPPKAKRSAWRAIETLGRALPIGRGVPTARRASLPRMMRAGGIGPLAWRQMAGAFRYRVGLFAVMTAPAILAVLPLLQQLRPLHTLMNVVAGLVFYSFLLLPAALKFDFRRDHDRLEMLKLLPLSPGIVVLGQLAAPILLTSLYQVGVLAATVILRPVSPAAIAAAVALLLPMNLLIYASENLIFLLSPYRQKQEGVEVFIRTILVFTGKAVVFGVGLLSFLIWSQLARSVAGEMAAWFGIAVDSRAVFLAGTWLAVTVTAFAALALLVRTYRRFDPSFDGGR